jgi:heat shock protein HslJ
VKKVHVFMFVVVFMFVLPSCDGSSSDPSSRLLPTGVLWSLQAFELNDGTTVDVVVSGEAVRYQVLFREDGRVEIKADCNVCGGTHETSGSALTIEVGGCTRAFCGDDSFDNEFKAALDSTSRFEVVGEDLLLVYALGRMRFRM